DGLKRRRIGARPPTPEPQRNGCTGGRDQERQKMPRKRVLWTARWSPLTWCVQWKILGGIDPISRQKLQLSGAADSSRSAHEHVRPASANGARAASRRTGQVTRGTARPLREGAMPPARDRKPSWYADELWLSGHVVVIGQP